MHAHWSNPTLFQRRGNRSVFSITTSKRSNSICGSNLCCKIKKNRLGQWAVSVYVSTLIWCTLSKYCVCAGLIYIQLLIGSMRYNPSVVGFARVTCYQTQVQSLTLQVVKSVNRKLMVYGFVLTHLKHIPIFCAYISLNLISMENCCQYYVETVGCILRDISLPPIALSYYRVHIWSTNWVRYCKLKHKILIRYLENFLN